jgi:hypothetical protein
MLREEAYVAARLDAQLEEQVRRFLSDRTRNRYANGAIEVSKIFDWYEKDFTSGYANIRSVQQFLAPYAQLLADRPAEQQAVRDGRLPLRYLEYDWRLNAAQPRG